MKVEVSWQGKMLFETSTDSGHKLYFDAAPEVGGENQGARPMEALLAAVGSCSGIDIIHILNRMRLSIESFSMEISGERASDHPRRFTDVHMHYKLTGNLPVEKVRRAVQLSVEKYCSVSQSLNANIIASFEINGITYQI